MADLEKKLSELLQELLQKRVMYNILTIIRPRDTIRIWMTISPDNFKCQDIIIVPEGVSKAIMLKINYA